jgi:predicted nucleic acid-binding protein
MKSLPKSPVAEQWVAILDDGAARRCARSLALNVSGTLAVVLLAKQYGLIESAAHVLYDLRGADFRLDDATIREALQRTVSETWKAGK